ncbi:MAG: hypothetical protein PHV11_06935 [Candidatus Bipolaricaulis sp.]|nr:hypothetical protein [Candidatus Bipolaricaulis sp.]
MANERCDTEAVVVRMENISVLKNLRQKVEDGKTHLPISVEDIDVEIETQRQSLEEEIAKCGSLEGVPEEALSEAGIGAEEASKEEELTIDTVFPEQEE